MIEELKQREMATLCCKLRRYDEARTEQYVRNKIFQTNKVKLFERLEKDNRRNDIRSEGEESVRFLSRILGQPVTHKDEAKWLKEVERQPRGTAKQESITVTTDKLKKQLQRVKNWKAPGL